MNARLVNPDFARLRVLCADAAMRSLYRQMLLEMGVGDVVVANDGASAYEKYRSTRPDIVITEMNLPLVNGLDLVRLIRTRPDSPRRRIPIIMCAGEATRQAILSARDLGVTEFLAKPISLAALRQRLETVVANPRPFVEAETFFGPDRRRGGGQPYSGPDRRGRRRSDAAEAQPGAAPGRGAAE